MRFLKRYKSKRRTKISGGEAGRIKNYMVGPSAVEIGRYTYGYEGITVREWGEGAALKIGSFCSIADGVVVMLGGNHRTDWITTFPFGHVFTAEFGGEDIVGHPKSNGDVVIGNDVWVGRHSTLMSGVRVGDGAVIAANSTVVKDIGAYEIWGGNPAKMIKSRFDEEIVARLIRLSWWTWDESKIKKVSHLLSGFPSMEILAEIERTAGR
jgi:acetyltransferase-like isoleucine patch superfamily enzyme